MEVLQADFGQHVETRLDTLLGTQVRKPFVAPREFVFRFFSLGVFPRSVGPGLVSMSRVFPAVSGAVGDESRRRLMSDRDRSSGGTGCDRVRTQVLSSHVG